MAKDNPKAADPKGAPKGKGDAAKGKGGGDAKGKGDKKGKGGAPFKPAEPPRLKVMYLNEVRTALKETFGYVNDNEIPKVTKVVINMGVGRARENPKILDEVSKHLTMLAGQAAVITQAKLSIANFKLREGMKVGCKVTLRKDRMWFFLDKLIALAIPRIRDFRGLSTTAFDGRGNYTMGLTEQGVFPEIDPAKLDHGMTQGMNVTINISGGSNEASRFLLAKLGMPFKRAEEAVGG